MRVWPYLFSPAGDAIYPSVLWAKGLDFETTYMWSNMKLTMIMINWCYIHTSVPYTVKPWHSGYSLYYSKHCPSYYGTIVVIVSVEWRGDTISQPLLVYHDEITAFNGGGTLICQSETLMQGWHFPNGNSVNMASPDIGGFQQFTARTATVLYRNQDMPLTANTSLNGLWSCRLNGDESGAIPVGIYSRGGGEWVCACKLKVLLKLMYPAKPLILIFMKRLLPRDYSYKQSMYFATVYFPMVITIFKHLRQFPDFSYELWP